MLNYVVLFLCVCVCLCGFFMENASFAFYNVPRCLRVCVCVCVWAQLNAFANMPPTLPPPLSTNQRPSPAVAGCCHCRSQHVRFPSIHSSRSPLAPQSSAFPCPRTFSHFLLHLDASVTFCATIFLFAGLSFALATAGLIPYNGIHLDSNISKNAVNYICCKLAQTIQFSANFYLFVLKNE